MFDRFFPSLRLLPVLGLGLLLACGTAAAPLPGPADQKDAQNNDNSPAAPTGGAPTQAPTPKSIAPRETPTPVTAAMVTATPENPVTPSPTATPKPTLSDEEAIRQQLRAAGISPFGWKTDFTKRSVEFSGIFSGGPPRDGIPPIDEPAFTTLEDADKWLNSKEPAIALEIGGDARAYPLQILIWHEIVNDQVGGVPVAVTFCPLCNSAITFDRRLDGVVHDFGTSGNLRNSDLIMWDRQTETWWQQLTGEGIVGELTGKRLTFLPSAIISWEDFKATYPDGQVLARPTDTGRLYGENPYVGYDRADSPPFLFSGDLDGRLLPKERVAAVNIGEVDAAFPFSTLNEERVVNYTVAGQDLVIFFKPGTRSALDQLLIGDSREVGATGIFDPELDGQKLTFRAEGEKFVDNETGSTWSLLGQAVEGPTAGKQLTPIIHANHLWFAWAAFKPDTLIYQGAGS